MVTQDRLYTVAEFEEIIARPENRDRLLELINGEIIEKMPTQQHGMCSVKISSRVLTWTEQGHPGRVAVKVRHQMPGDEHNSRLPDISFYADMTTPVVERGAMLRMPDLAVEIKSPDDTFKKMAEKAEYYLANGVRMVWLVYPEKKLVEVLTPDDRQLLKEDDILDGGDVLPGFAMPVHDIFAY